MKILSASQIREADAYTIAHEPITSDQLMERASNVFVLWYVAKFTPGHPVAIFCGNGNNGGDGLAIARLLSEKGYQVSVWLLDIGNTTKDRDLNEQRLAKLKDVPQQHLSEGDILPTLSDRTVVIDAIFGSGLNRPVTGWIAQLIDHLNEQPVIRISVDIPSGLYADSISQGTIFKAHHTLSFETPRLSFLFAEHGDYVGEWEFRSIGLHDGFVSRVASPYRIIAPQDVKLKSRTRHSHKGTYGHSLIIAGGYGKIGAAILASKACLRTGAGLVTAYIPQCGYHAMQTALPEVMVITDAHERSITAIPDVSTYNAIGIGPGIGQEPGTLDALIKLIQQAKKPLVVDADALNILAHNTPWLNKLPALSIITPHPKEFERLFGHSKDSFERLQLARRHAKEHNIIIILKGAYTAIISPQQDVWFNSTGNPGMATGGSGDVLTGIITGMLSQGYEPLQAAINAVYLHGSAGDLAAETFGQEAMIAGDIVAHLGKAIKMCCGG
ncbi:bifunctional ADP-dependent NAD(P)H-hydrate dehydratase/NAD(P)H-hydrate epimerase [soil metagenome]